MNYLPTVTVAFSKRWLEQQLLEMYGRSFSPAALGEIYDEAVLNIESSLNAGVPISLADAVGMACCTLGYMDVD